MKNPCSIGWRLVGAALSICVCTVLAQTSSGKRIDDKTLREAGKNGDEWLTYGRDYAETHYSPLKQIDASNVKRLGLAWSWDTDSPTGGHSVGCGSSAKRPAARLAHEADPQGSPAGGAGTASQRQGVAQTPN